MNINTLHKLGQAELICSCDCFRYSPKARLM